MNIPVEHQIAVLKANGWTDCYQSPFMLDEGRLCGIVNKDEGFTVCPEPSFDLLRGALLTLVPEKLKTFYQKLYRLNTGVDDKSEPVTWYDMRALSAWIAPLEYHYAAFFKVKGGGK